LEDVNWQLAGVVRQIISLGKVLDSITFCHILREWNKVADGLAKWAFERRGNWKVDDWSCLPEGLSWELEDLVMEDLRCVLGVA